MDRLMHLMLRGSIVGLISACVVVALTFLYSAMFAMIGLRWHTAAVTFLLALACALAITQLWRYRNDLIYC